MKRLLILFVPLLLMLLRLDGVFLTETFDSGTDEWVSCTPMPEALNALESDDEVTVTSVPVDDWFY